MRFSKRALHGLLFVAAISLLPSMSFGDSSGPRLASYYDRHMAILDGAAFGWTGSNRPRLMLKDVKQVGVSKDSYFALRADGSLVKWSDDARNAKQISTGVSSFAAGQSGIFVIDSARVLWLVGENGPPQMIADSVLTASIGDGANYFIRTDGLLFVKGNAHRGQYGDGRLRSTPDYVRTADGATDVKAHTGHAIYLSHSGDVLGTGGNVYGPLSTHGLGDKAASWGKIFSDAKGIATGASHSVAIRRDNSLWIWGSGYGTAPRKILSEVVGVAAGNGDTIALTADGALWQWEAGSEPRRLQPLIK